MITVQKKNYDEKKHTKAAYYVYAYKSKIGRRWLNMFCATYVRHLFSVFALCIKFVFSSIFIVCETSIAGEHS